ncbi:hypothetical protein HYPDE_26788 [Hyphomicrobium denitrificans 1NES1]|uniref:Uncharacterized protein n=1 Tax=Hyphomicrobium denitrificans 1NES1 TaxID=670307 RepID=N0B280_9HYPH|nr:hypothetical protein [Hyphomicrobium denitrificans]AGK57038.1 hypothetical protein HYPDE_26788 [Hyphomicrobium denitrificans 1NES1]
MTPQDYADIRRKHRWEALSSLSISTIILVAIVYMLLTIDDNRWPVYGIFALLGAVVVAGFDNWIRQSQLSDAANPAMYEVYKREQPEGPIFALLQKRFGDQ